MPTDTAYPFHLRRERERKGWTQAELAAKSGVPQNQISEYETGRKRPGWDAFNRLADALGVKLDRLRQGVEK